MIVSSLRGEAEAIQKNPNKNWIASASPRNDELLEISTTKWDEIKEKITKTTMPARQIEDILKKSESAMSIEAIGWNEQDFATACTTSRFTRDRFTFLDVF